VEIDIEKGLAALQQTTAGEFSRIAAILARGVARHAQSARRDDLVMPKEVSDSPQSCLEVGEKPRLSGSRCHGI